MPRYTHLLRALASTSTGTRVRPVPRRPISAKTALTLTPTAVQRVEQLINDNPGVVGLRIGVKTRGCNGLTYTLDFATKKEKLDEEVVQNGARVFIDFKAQLTLLGAEMDFQESKLSSEFVFNNPNISGTCGCGESFTI